MEINGLGGSNAHPLCVECMLVIIGLFSYKTFEELVDMAEKGDGHNVDSYVADERKSSASSVWIDENKADKQPAYFDVVDDDIISINFGKAVEAAEGNTLVSSLQHTYNAYDGYDFTSVQYLD